MLRPRNLTSSLVAGALGARLAAGQLHLVDAGIPLLDRAKVRQVMPHVLRAVRCFDRSGVSRHLVFLSLGGQQIAAALGDSEAVQRRSHSRQSRSRSSWVSRVERMRCSGRGARSCQKPPVAGSRSG